MGSRRLYLSLTFLAAGSCGCAAATASSGSPAPALAERVERLLDEPPFDRVQWGVLVIDARSGRTLYERDPDLLFIPGSNMKLPVAAAGFGLLGPDYRWQTAVYSHVLPVNGTLEGDLYLAAQGDPTLGEPFHPSARDALLGMVDSIRAAGIGRIEGRFVVDVSGWDSTTVAQSWMVEDLMGSDAATGGAFSVADGEIQVRVSGGARPGDPAEVVWEPAVDPGPGPAVEARIETVAGAASAQIDVSFVPESLRWNLDGEIPAGETRTLSLSQRDPVRVGLAALAEALEERGIPPEQGMAVVWDPDSLLDAGCLSGHVPSCSGMLRIAGVASPPLSEVADEMLGASRNWTAEQLIRTLGAERGDRGSWTEGFRVTGDYLASQAGVAPEDIHFEDGSGLSNHDLVSPRALVRILDHARRQPWAAAFKAALAQPGVEGTTLSDRLEGLQGRVFAKTGSLSHVNSLSGYLVADDGRDLIFSVLSNGANLPSSQVRSRIDEFVTELVTPSR